MPLDSGHRYEETKAFARTVARHLVARDAGVVDVMAKARRAGKVFVDWSQNDAGKSTIAPYSLRGLWYPTVSLPLTWDEVEAAVAAGARGSLVFLARGRPRAGRALRRPVRGRPDRRSRCSRPEGTPTASPADSQEPSSS